MSESTLELYRQAFHSLARTLPGAELAWLRAARRRAFERFEKLGFPGTRLEDWKYTDVAAIAGGAWHFTSPRGDDADVSSIVDELVVEKTAARLVFVNGRHAPKLSRAQSLPDGVFVGSLTRALREIPEQLEPAMGHETPKDGFAALNAAFVSDGYVVVLPRDCRLEQPLQMLFVTDEAGLAMHPSNVVLAAPGAQCTVVEQFAGVADDAYLTNVVTRIVAQEQAQIEHCRIQHEAKRSFHIGHLDIVGQRASRVVSHSFAFGAALSRVQIDADLAAADAYAELDGLYFLRGRQHADHHTRIDHEYPRGTSRQYYRGVLDGASRGVFNGRVVVHQDAQRTDTHQSNHNLLLSADAEIDTKPQLEIYADDVKCTHGATVGRLDENQLFYLRARGIDEAAARACLLEAFARDVLERVSNERLRDKLTGILLARMPGAQQGWSRP
ncbi:Fe-S cluster assembly protein SufD [Trinickia caryophylli]|uniref:Iron-regulated ABC transporter permease protein SufD n=1 Tax=Trinickia caryophylli TaxID=28094 RepID=A0A1X7DE93_TRICW|nr:Fe-S cluster assembly protein SufD [Trinickia caryophylli]PMS09801.1 Fe-S cluster assembly protein SufD [Trinickia caryophylli]TRX16866.1 Fe-S cluster assembly protein SufD [Trinickia caryophylli]WQE12404.1 Fe-S cluster assembly protein SufD [Trinickia caryophylli]SMF13875.1 Iron-regulated ABC transporter permease protein SufD [Trinickia caryophylli]GLU31448.1 Fe-S cluster assembly protein SufD [Trinickia caryophylli]